MAKTRDKIDESRLPDGGWGWMVVLGVALTNTFNQSLVSVFGLLFGEQIERMGHATSGVAFVMNMNNMVTSFSGLIMGPLLKRYTCKEVSLSGAVFAAAGMMLSSFASTLWELAIFYGILTGLGLGLMYTSTFVAIKCYFSTKRGRAVGISMAGTGLGQMMMPQLVQFLLDNFGYRWATRIIGALCLNGVVGALLFQPVKWHLKKVVHDPSTEHQLLASDTIELNIEEKGDVKNKENEIKAEKNGVQSSEKINPNSKEKIDEVKEGENENSSLWQKITAVFDLNLLKDSVFINITIGLALTYVAGVNFMMIFPFFLQESVGLTRVYTARCMSILAAADIVARLTLPSITFYAHVSNRTTFLFGALLLGVARSVIAQQTDEIALYVTSAFCGYIRAATIINQNLTCSDYVRDEELPAALGLIMVARALFVISVGQLLGFFRDYSESYSLSIHVSNILLFTIFVCWSIEMIVVRRRKAAIR